ncbi:MAG: hypothetical protein OXG35_01135, partial [Acidobacteria bacterium]|nr:hypothetical protein [Acidobacteriota bacterium]
VGDRATFDDPHQYPEGIAHVVVGGAHTIRDEEQTGGMAGRAVRGGGPAADRPGSRGGGRRRGGRARSGARRPR